MDAISKWLTDNGFSIATGGMYYKLIGPAKMVSTLPGKPFGKQRMTFMFMDGGEIKGLDMYEGDEAGAIPWFEGMVKKYEDRC